jgi:hypothetical protein
MENNSSLTQEEEEERFKKRLIDSIESIKVCNDSIDSLHTVELHQEEFRPITKLEFTNSKQSRPIMALTEEEEQRVLNLLDELELDEARKEEHRLIFKLVSNLGKTKPKNSNQPSSDNNPCQDKNNE